jgi:hypothetical protein
MTLMKVTVNLTSQGHIQPLLTSADKYTWLEFSLNLSDNTFYPELGLQSWGHCSLLPALLSVFLACIFLL